jgi:hypothetical protein
MKLGFLIVAMALAVLYGQAQSTQRAEAVDLSQKRGAGVEEGKAALRTFCLELAATEKKTRGRLSPGLLALRPLCSAASNPNAIQMYSCNGANGGTAGSCAKDYNESVSTGLSICGDLKHLCEAVGAKWTESAAR